MSKTVSNTNSLATQPSGYDSSNSSYSSISSTYPITNAYTNSSSDTYAYITTNTGSGATTYISLTFDLSSIPTDATINSVSCSVKAAMSTTTTSRIASAVAQLYNGTTAMGSSASILVAQTSASSTSLTCGTWTRSQLDNLELRFTATRGTSRTTSAYYMYIYGADLTISYTYDTTVYVVTISSSGDGTVSPTGEQEVEPAGSLDITLSPGTGVQSTSITDNGSDVTAQLSSNVYTLSNVAADHTIVVTYISVTYSVTSSITNGTITSPTDNPVSVAEGNSVTITFKGDDEKTFKYMKVDGEEVTPSAVDAGDGQDSTTATYTYETNYDVYSTYYLSQAFDGSTSDYFWSNGAQTAGKYILITFNKYINLTAFSTYSSNSTDYPNTCNELQCSADGTNWTTLGTFQASQTSTFSNLSTGNIKYVRIYATSTISNWLVLNTVTMTYTTPEIPGTSAGYQYTISNITSDKIVEIKFAGNDGVFMKISGAWTQADKVYKKTDSGWQEIEPQEFYTLTKGKKVIVKK